jgi:hypothetical protein
MTSVNREIRDEIEISTTETELLASFFGGGGSIRRQNINFGDFEIMICIETHFLTSKCEKIPDRKRMLYASIELISCTPSPPQGATRYDAISLRCLSVIFFSLCVALAIKFKDTVILHRNLYWAYCVTSKSSSMSWRT